MGLGTNRDRRVAAAVLLCALALSGVPAGAATLSLSADGASGDLPIQSARPAGGIGATPGGWTLFSANRNFLAAGAGPLADPPYRDVTLASVYSNTAGVLPHWSHAQGAGGDKTGRIAVKAPLSFPALQATFYLLLIALMLSAAVGHFRSSRTPAH